MTIVLAHHAYYRLLVDLVGLVDETLQAVAHVDDPLRVRLLGLAANFGWQRGDLALAERYSKEALELGDSLGVTSSTAAAHQALGTALMMRGDRDGASIESERARCIAAADGDHYTEALALTDLGLSASYAGDDTAAASYGDALDTLATAVGAPSIRGWAAYLHGERLAERDPTAATRHLTDAFAAAEEVDERFLAGVARHTLMTTAARMDEAGHAVTSFAGLLDQWNGSGAWTQLWLTMRALIEALSRDGRHREAARPPRGPRHEPQRPSRVRRRRPTAGCRRRGRQTTPRRRVRRRVVRGCRARRPAGDHARHRPHAPCARRRTPRSPVAIDMSPLPARPPRCRSQSCSCRRWRSRDASRMPVIHAESTVEVPRSQVCSPANSMRPCGVASVVRSAAWRPGSVPAAMLA